MHQRANPYRSAEVRPLLDRYLRGSNGVEAMDRVKLMKLLWDSRGTEFGGRHELYERNYAGNQEDTRIQLKGAQAKGPADQLRSFEDGCLGEYDINGWTSEHLINPGSMSSIPKLQ
jgi:4-hydroxyphenylacetate 3-monooxygenase